MVGRDKVKKAIFWCEQLFHQFPVLELFCHLLHPTPSLCIYLYIFFKQPLILGIEGRAEHKTGLSEQGRSTPCDQEQDQ